MPQKNHMKTPPPEQETLRGTGKLGWTESGKMHSNAKKLTASFSNDEVKPGPSKNKKTIKCPGCGRNFKSNSGKLPEHKGRWYHYYINGSSNICSQKKPMGEEPIIVSRVESVIINGYEIRKGDSVAFTTYPWHVPFQDWNELKEYKVIELYLMDTGRIHLDIGVQAKDNFGWLKPYYISSTIFAKNFIKL